MRLFVERFVTARDEKVCGVCAAYDGRIIGEGGVPDVPVHPGCRCVAVVEQYDEHTWSEACRREYLARSGSGLG